MVDKEKDELDQKLFEYFENNNDISDCAQKAMNDAFDSIRAKKNRSPIYKIRRVAVVLFCFGIVTSGIVFAKEIVSFITSKFTNSTPGIDAAVENGFAQEIDMDFVYNNGIGIRVDSILINDTVLDISFEYDVTDKYNNINNIKLGEYEIKDENDNLIIKLSKDIKINCITINPDSISTTYHDMASIFEEDYYKSSVLFKSSKYPKVQNLQFNINSICLNDNKENEIFGEWNFNIDLNNNSQNESKTNEKTINPNIVSLNKSLNETTYKVEIEFTEEFDDEIIHNFENIILKDGFGKIYNVTAIYDISKTKIIVEFDYGKFNIEDNLNLYIKYSKDKEVNINL